MKITILSKSATVLIAVLFFACGGGESTAEKSAKEETVAVAKTPEPTPPVESAPQKETEPEEEVVNGSASKKMSGEDKVANSDCLSCHYMDKQIVGPAFLDIAAEYANNEENIAMLAEKVIKGGSGIWGETVMPPHTTLSEEDAKDMVSYILGLK